MPSREARHHRKYALGVPAFAKATARPPKLATSIRRAEAEGPSATGKMLGTSR